MKKSLLCRLAVAGTALFLSTLTIFPVYAAQTGVSLENGVGPGFEETLPDSYDGPSDPLDTEKRSEKDTAGKNETAETAKNSLEAEKNAEASASDEVKSPLPEGEIETGTQGESLGTFKISAYCSCSRCSGGHKYTYSGTIPQAKHTISADLDQFPLGTKLWIDGIIYTVEDMGSGVGTNCLDIYFDTHEEALDYGVKNVEVFSLKTP